jgi:hypothetical protein
MGTLASTLGVLVAVCGTTPHEAVSRDRVDLVEVNHFYDDLGRHVFDQIIFYDWSPEHCRHLVRAWRMVKKPNQFPQRNWTDGSYTALWNDGEILREVRAATMRESWTQYDPELIEREILPKEKRRELRTVSAALPKQAALRPSQTPPPRREATPEPRNPDPAR